MVHFTIICMALVSCFCADTPAFFSEKEPVMPKFSVKKPLTVFVTVLAVLILGVVSYLRMTPDLLRSNTSFPAARS